MSLFSGLFKSRDKPQNRTSGSNYAFFFGGTTSGKAATNATCWKSTHRRTRKPCLERQAADDER